MKGRLPDCEVSQSRGGQGLRMRWLYHVRPTGQELPERYAPPSFDTEGFIHASYRDDVAESARLHFPAGSALEVLRIDPRRLDVPVIGAATPRGEMPHIKGSIPSVAVAGVLPLDVFLATVVELPDWIP